MKISASVVTYNNENEIKGVLDSLINSSCIDNMDVYVVDNCSVDKTKEIIKKEYPKVKLIESKNNAGYGGGHNQALRVTNAEYHFVINPDILFEKDLIQHIVDYMDKHEEVVMCIPAVHDMDGELKCPPKRDPKLRYLFARFFPKMGFTKKWLKEYQREEEVKNAKEPFEIEICSGSFMAMRKKAAEAIGYFDERYFMYFEDFDISRSIRKKGKIMYLPQFQIIHEGKRAAHHSKAAKKMLTDSMKKYYKKWGWKF